MLPPDLLGRLEQALKTVTRGAAKQGRHQARLEASGVQLSLPAYWILSECAERGPLTVSGLAESVDMQVPQVSRELKRLADTALVTRTPDPKDSRVTIVTITPPGTQAVQRYRHAAGDQIEAVVATWSLADVEALTTLLERFAAEVRRIQYADQAAASG